LRHCRSGTRQNSEIVNCHTGSTARRQRAGSSELCAESRPGAHGQSVLPCNAILP